MKWESAKIKFVVTKAMVSLWFLTFMIITNALDSTESQQGQLLETILKKIKKKTTKTNHWTSSSLSIEQKVQI